MMEGSLKLEGNLGVTDDVTGQVKIKMPDDLTHLALPALKPYQMEISQNSNRDRVWDT